MNFVVRDTLIYQKKRQRFCIFKSLDKYIFELIHDKNQHFEINRCYFQIAESFLCVKFFQKTVTIQTHYSQ